MAKHVLSNEISYPKIKVKRGIDYIALVVNINRKGLRYRTEEEPGDSSYYYITAYLPELSWRESEGVSKK